MTLRINLMTCAVISVMALGCSTESPSQSSGDTAPAGHDSSDSKKASPKTPAISLAPAGDPTPPLDGGRVQSTMPKGWKFLPRSNDFLFAAYFEEKGGVPRLVLREQEAGDLPETASAETAKPLAEAIRKEFPSGKESSLTVLNIGDNWFVRFEKKMSFRSLPASGVFLVTVQDGKRFTLELLSYAEKKDQFLPALYRFAGDLKVQEIETQDSDESVNDVEASSELKGDSGSDPS